MNNLIPITKIRIPPNRQRREFNEGALRELADSLSKPSIGILHPPVLRKQGEEFFLVAGERRIRALQDNFDLGLANFYQGQALPINMVPYTDLGDLDQLAAEEAELEENVRRVDLTWQEKAMAMARLFDLRAKQSPELPRTKVVTNMAAELIANGLGQTEDGTRQSVNNDLILASALDDPDVAKATSATQATKILKRKLVAQQNERIAAVVGKTFTSDVHDLRQGNSAELMKSLAAESVDVILTDPPYGMGADEFGDSGGMAVGAHGYADTAETLRGILTWLPGETFRVAKPNAHLYLFCDLDWYHILWEEFSAAGWKVFRTPMIWHKPAGFRAPWPDAGPQRKYETILYAVKGDRKVNMMRGDVLTYNSDENLGHAAQKPVSLYRDLLERSVVAGNTVLDAFAGTGPIISAAHELKCKTIAFELDAAHFGIMLSRKAALK